MGLALALAGAATGVGYALDGRGPEPAAASSVTVPTVPVPSPTTAPATTPTPAAPVEPLGPGLVTVRLGIEHSVFSRSVIEVEPGTLVRFVVANDDPIDHELVVGPEDVHDRHARGTEREHPPVPGEVSVGPNDTALTIYTFDEPGLVTFACHLPRHREYGMEGIIKVVAP